MRNPSAALRGTVLLVVGLFLSLGVAGCDLFSSDVSFDSQLEIKLTDAPFPADRVQAANVTIEKVVIVDRDKEALLIMDEAKSFELTELTAGNQATLVSRGMPPGEYAQLQITVGSSATLTDDGGNSREISVGEDSDRTVSVGLGRLIIESGGTGRVTLDFSLENSFQIPEDADPATVSLSEVSYAPSILLQSVTDGLNTPNQPQQPDG